MIVIHPNDRTTSFLRKIYEGENNVTIIDENWNSRNIREKIGSSDKSELIMMLGHGYNRGLFAPYGDNQFARTIVDDRLVYLLKEHPCVGIWCYANEFAENYGLRGLFSGMIVSEESEAQAEGLDHEGEDIGALNRQFAYDLAYCMRKYSLDLIPHMMTEIQDYHSPIKDFNYNNLYYYKGYNK